MLAHKMIMRILYQDQRVLLVAMCQVKLKKQEKKFAHNLLFRMLA
jgi:hypothetical protein